MNRVFLLLVTLVFLFIFGACRPAAESNILIELRRTGGFAGVDERLQVYRDGKAVVETKKERKEFDIPESQLAAITKAIEQVEWDSLRKEYVPENTCCDLLTFEITYFAPNGQKYSVRMMSNSIPEDLMPVLEQLGVLLQ